MMPFNGMTYMQPPYAQMMYPQQIQQPLQIQPTDSTDKNENMRVAIRIRPLLPFELKRGDKSAVQINNKNTINIIDKDGNKDRFWFNNIIPEYSTQHEAFTQTNVTTLLDSALNGFSATVLSYGQTGSGKTYTFFN